MTYDGCWIFPMELQNETEAHMLVTESFFLMMDGVCILNVFYIKCILHVEIESKLYIQTYKHCVQAH